MIMLRTLLARTALALLALFLVACAAATPTGLSTGMTPEGESAKLELARDFRSERHSVWGITARNREQLGRQA